MLFDILLYKNSIKDSCVFGFAHENVRYIRISVAFGCQLMMIVLLIAINYNE